MEESFVIKSSEVKVLEEKIDEINKIFEVKVEIQKGPKAEKDGIEWVQISGNANDKNDAKTHIIALCNPELKERISFSGFPMLIFKAFEERCKHVVQRECGVVMSTSEGDWVTVQGTNIGVTLTTSKLYHLNKLHKEKDLDKHVKAAEKFDCYIKESDEERKEELQTLSNSLKKEILDMLNIAVEPVARPTLPPVIDITDDTIIEINDSQDESAITLSSGSEAEDSDSSDSRPELAHDGLGSSDDISYLLPPNFVIRRWVQVHYEGTNDPNNHVLKNEMLKHFRDHFDIPDHPELANIFFDKLAVRIFPQDPSFRSVKTKKTKNKLNRRRLVCLRRKTVSESDKDDEVGAVASPPAVAYPPAPQGIKGVMVDWNANRTAHTVSGSSARQTMPQVPQQGTIRPVSQPTVIRMLDARVWPTQQQLLTPLIPQVMEGQPRQNVNWTNVQKTTPSVTLPVPALRTRPQQNNQPENLYRSIASRVSKMTNEELILRHPPPVNPNLRPIVIDGSNVAMSHGNHKLFSCRGIAICVRFFMERGHGNIKCFVPNYRKGGGGSPPSNDANLLRQLEDKGYVKPTPSRRIQGQNIVCYDDRFIVELAEANGGVILSNDQYRDLMWQEPRWRPIIESRLLQYTMVDDLLMLPEDPLGRNGPPLDTFLSLRPNRPAGPTAVTPKSCEHLPGPTTKPAQPPQNVWSMQNRSPGRRSTRPPLSPQLSDELAKKMLDICPGRMDDIQQVMREHPSEGRIERLMEYLLLNDAAP